MKLWRYVARYHLGACLLALISLVMLMVAVTLVENADLLGDMEEGNPASSALRLAFYAAGRFSFQMFPVAFFLGTLVAGTQLARRGEFLAMQAAGIHPWRLWGCFCAVVGVAAASCATFGAYVMPAAISHMDQINREELGHLDAVTAFYSRPMRWFREGDALLYLPSVDARGPVFHHPTIYMLRDGMIASIIRAKTMRHDGRTWRLEDASEQRIADAEVTRETSRQLPLRIMPQDLLGAAGNPRSLGVHELFDLIIRRQRRGLDATSYQLELHDRFAFPLTGLAMVLLILPWATNPERRRSLAVNLGVGVITIAAQLAAIQVFRLAALGHKIPHAVGAWGPAALCLALLPASLMLKTRHRSRGSIF